jgi:hypothetical protein
MGPSAPDDKRFSRPAETIFRMLLRARHRGGSKRPKSRAFASKSLKIHRVVTLSSF